QGHRLVIAGIEHAATDLLGRRFQQATVLPSHVADEPEGFEAQLAAHVKVAALANHPEEALIVTADAGTPNRRRAGDAPGRAAAILAADDLLGQDFALAVAGIRHKVFVRPRTVAGAADELRGGVDRALDRLRGSYCVADVLHAFDVRGVSVQTGFFIGVGVGGVVDPGVRFAFLADR